jgi:hypothetical protein
MLTAFNSPVKNEIPLYSTRSDQRRDAPRKRKVVLRRSTGGILMPEWLERALNVFVGASVLLLAVKYRDKGILRRIGESKYRFRRWIKGNAK